LAEVEKKLTVALVAWPELGYDDGFSKFQSADNPKPRVSNHAHAAI
jgi:hypothetical protein